MKAWELINDRSKWTQNANARDDHGGTCYPLEEDACQWCISGAITKVYGPYTAEGEAAMEKLRDVCESRHGMGPITVNDTLGHKAILECAKEADV